MPSIEELRATRVAKLKKLEAAGILAYPAKSSRTHFASGVTNDFRYQPIPSGRKPFLVPSFTFLSNSPEMQKALKWALDHKCKMASKTHTKEEAKKELIKTRKIGWSAN